jgi:hypothetical protein
MGRPVPPVLRGIRPRRLEFPLTVDLVLRAQLWVSSRDVVVPITILVFVRAGLEILHVGNAALAGQRMRASMQSARCFPPTPSTAGQNAQPDPVNG